MALEISYSPQFFDNLEGILKYFDERNGSDNFSKKLLKMIHKQIKLASAMPEIGRLTDFPGVRILFVERLLIFIPARRILMPGSLKNNDFLNSLNINPIPD